MCGLRGLNVSIIYVYYTCYIYLNNLPECSCPEDMKCFVLDICLYLKEG